MSPRSGLIDLPLGRHPRDPTKFAVQASRCCALDFLIECPGIETSTFLCFSCAIKVQVTIKSRPSMPNCTYASQVKTVGIVKYVCSMLQQRFHLLPLFQTDGKGKESQTEYFVREVYEGYSLVELHLLTGRCVCLSQQAIALHANCVFSHSAPVLLPKLSHPLRHILWCRTHQIRVHLSHMKHPIVGDVVYGGKPLTVADVVRKQNMAQVCVLSQLLPAKGTLVLFVFSKTYWCLLCHFLCRVVAHVGCMRSLPLFVNNIGSLCSLSATSSCA
jgi:hypothetical protein